MKIPKMLKKISQMNEQTKLKVEKIISESLKKDYISSFPIEDFTTLELDLLAEYAKENNLLIALKAEHSNFHQGVLVSLLKKELIAEFKDYI